MNRFMEVRFGFVHIYIVFLISYVRTILYA